LLFNAAAASRRSLLISAVIDRRYRRGDWLNPRAARIWSRMKAHVVVMPKAAVLDPQGAAVRDAMKHLGMPEVRSVRIGKYLEIDVDGEDVDLEKKLHGLCRDLLSNPVIEDYELKKE
jgi:phosphoribosylformylglycinamidine synthase subunit PurS